MKKKWNNRKTNYPAPVNIIYRGYKDPLIPLPKHYYGYEGIVLEDADTGRIQCHICGRWFYSLAGHLKTHKDFLEGKGIHITKQNTIANAYKDMFGLMHGTALCSDNIRGIIIETRKNNFYWEKERQQEWAKKYHERGSHHGVNNLTCAEKKNKKGTCFVQLLDIIKRKTIKTGRIPSITSLVGSDGQHLESTILRTFGSYANALKLLKLEVVTQRKRSLGIQFLLQCLKDFRKTNGRDPSVSDFHNDILPAENLYNKYFGGYEKALKMI